jgi:hypothetical protein
MLTISTKEGMFPIDFIDQILDLHNLFLAAAGEGWKWAGGSKVAIH